MTETLKIACEYCERLMPVTALERRHDRLVCKDVQACDKADEKREKVELAELRKRLREGDDLTEAEKHRLS